MHIVFITVAVIVVLAVLGLVARLAYQVRYHHSPFRRPRPAMTAEMLRPQGRSQRPLTAWGSARRSGLRSTLICTCTYLVTPPRTLRLSGR